MIDTAMLGFSFTAGVAVFFNPCGFPMLPPFIAAYVGQDGEAQGRRWASLGRGLKVGLASSAGFVSLFAPMGVVVALAGSVIQSYVPWIAAAIGLALVILGSMLVIRKNFDLSLPLYKLSALVRQRQTQTKAGGMLFFFSGGISYAIVSLGCVFPAFLIVVTMAFTGGVVNGLAQFVAYSVGMSLPMLGLSLATAFFYDSVRKHLRVIMFYVKKAAGVVMVAAGLYVIWYQLFLSRLIRL